MPYVFVSALTFLNLSRKILPPQHMGVNPVSDYPVNSGVRALSKRLKSFENSQQLVW